MEAKSEFAEAVRAVDTALIDYNKCREMANAAYVKLSQAIIRLDTMVEVAVERGMDLQTTESESSAESSSALPVAKTLNLPRMNEQSVHHAKP
jgi:hypothetical protein